jgi:hypothetical protein
MEDSGIPTFVMLIAAAVLTIGVIVGMFAVTWLILLK